MFSFSLTNTPQLQTHRVYKLQESFVKQTPTNPSLTVSDSFVRTNEPLPAISSIRSGEFLGLGDRQIKTMLIFLGLAGACYFVVDASTKSVQNTHKEIVKKALKEDREDFEKTHPLVSTPVYRTCSANVGEWFVDNILPALMAMGADAAGKQGDQALIESIKRSVDNLVDGGELITPQTFDRMLSGIAFSREKKDVLRGIINRVVIAVNENDSGNEINDGRLLFGKSQLLHSRTLSNDSFKVQALNAGIQSVENALPDIPAIIRYDARQNLADLYAEKANTRVGQLRFCSSFKAGRQARYNQELAYKEAELSRFVYGFLEGLIEYEDTQFTKPQLRSLKEMLNNLAQDLRPLANLPLMGKLREVIESSEYEYDYEGLQPYKNDPTKILGYCYKHIPTEVAKQLPYAEELPHRRILIHQGLDFEPYW